MKWVLAALLLAAVVHAEQESVLLILEGDVEKIKITHSQRSKHETDVAWCGNVWGARKGIDVGSQHHYNMQYTVNGETCVVGLFGDDEKHPGSRSEWVEDTNPWYLPSFLSKESARMTPKGHFIKHTPLYTLHIHTEATGLLLTALNGTVITPLHLPTRKASPTEVIPGVEGGIFTTIQSIGDPKDTQNLVFLSAGYLAGEDATFNADVEAAINYLQFDAAQFPLARYFPAMNTFSIFEPSVDKGASKPANGVTVNNNLGCTYGTGSSTEPARILQCSRPRTISLADTGPASAGLVNTVVIVLVNDNDYGGSGLYSTTLRMATLYSKPLKATDPVGRSLLFHELGHAMTDLSDEYTVAATESGRNCAPPFNNKYDTSLPLCEKNCAASTKDLGWQGWIDKGEVPATPGQGCYFSNFFKPGKLDGTPCIMEKVEGKTLCPVCREASALQLYSNGLNLTRPTCPHAEKTVTFLSLEVGSENATFFVNDKLFHVLSNRDEREYDLTWMLDDQVIPVASGSYVILSAIQNSLSVGRHTLSISVVDKTSFILPQHRPVIMDNATSVWQIEVVNSLNDITTELGDSARFTCPSSGPFRATLTPTQYRYYARCTSPDGNCNFNYTTKAYENPTDLDETVKAIENWIFGLGGALVGAGLCIFIFLYFILIIMSDEPKKCMEDTMSKPIKYADHAHHHNHRYIGRILVSSNIVFVLGAIGLCVFLAVLYQKVGAVAKLGLIAGMAMAGGLFLIGSVGWTSAYSKKYVPHNTTNPNRVVPLIFSSCLLLLIILAIMVVVVLLYYVGYNSDDNGSSVQSYLEDQWTDAVSSDPGLVCTAQKQFKCSGWNVACDRVFSPKNCPSDCELTNALYSQTCKVEVITFLHKWLPIVSSCLLFLVYLLLCGVCYQLLTYNA